MCSIVLAARELFKYAGSVHICPARLLVVKARSVFENRFLNNIQIYAQMCPNVNGSVNVPANVFVYVFTNVMVNVFLTVMVNVIVFVE